MMAMTDTDWEREYWKQVEREWMREWEARDYYECYYADAILIPFLNNKVSEEEARASFVSIRHPDMFERYVLDFIASGRAG